MSSLRLPQGLFWRLAAILFGALALALAITAQFVDAERAQLQRELIASHAAGRLAEAARMLAAVDAAAQPALTAALAAAGVQFDRDAPAAAPRDTVLHEAFAAALAWRLGSASLVDTAVAADGAGRVRFSAQLRAPAGNAGWWSIEEGFDRALPPPRFVLPSLVALLLAVGAAALLAVRWVTQPLSALATAARTLGTAAERGPLPERGPAEVRQAARAFNDMRRRIGAMVDEKTRMLAAISHDLRAPIARMRLRVEMLDDAEARTKLVGDLDELRRLTDEALDFLRGAGGGEQVAPCDLAQLARALVWEAREAGQQVTLAEAGPILLAGRAGALRRCLQNLIGNAIKHTGSAEVELAAHDGAAWVWVRDRGAGLAPAEFEQAFEPFYRGDPARGHAAGFGLGLPIARAIARQHGGDVTLRARTGGGLEAELKLPLTAPVTAA